MNWVTAPEHPFISRPPGGFWGRGARGGTSHTESGKCEIGRARALSPLSRLPRRGGWGGLLGYQEKERELWGGEPDTTNNRMELQAAIEGLRALSEPCRVKLTTDSQYVRKGITEWISAWKQRGWRTAAKKPCWASRPSPWRRSISILWI